MSTPNTPQDDSREKAKAAFIEWFEQNYPPDCILSRPSWHAPKIFNAAFHAMSSARSEKAPILAPHYTRAEVHNLYKEWVERAKLGESGSLPALAFDGFYEGFMKAQELDVLAATGQPRTVAPSAGTRTVAHPVKDADLFICCADGEGSHEFRVCHGYEGVAAFYQDMCGFDADGTTDSLKRTFDDPDEWRNDGAMLELELYCAKFSVWKVNAAELAMPAGFVQSATEPLKTHYHRGGVSAEKCPLCLTDADKQLGISICERWPVDLADVQGIIEFVRANGAMSAEDVEALTELYFEHNRMRVAFLHKMQDSVQPLDLKVEEDARRALDKIKPKENATDNSSDRKATDV